MPGLLTLKTDLKSLKYGQDRPGGGDSGQPYIKTDINTVDSGFNRLRLTKFDDGLIRGGVIGALNASVVDTIRIGKFLTDPPKGPLFIVKQVGLQLSNPRLESKEVKTDRAQSGGGFFSNAINTIANIAGKIENAVGPTRIYNLGINTLAQVPINALGGHIVRHGFLPIPDPSKYYESVVTANNKNGTNRLEKLTNSFGLGGNAISDKRSLKKSNKFDNFTKSTLATITTGKITPAELVIDSYIGGAGSVYGIGSTLIRRTLTFTADKSKIDEAKLNSKIFAGKSRNSKGEQQEIKIKDTFDWGVSTFTSSIYNSNTFDLLKDPKNQLSSSFINNIANNSNTGSENNPTSSILYSKVLGVSTQYFSGSAELLDEAGIDIERPTYFFGIDNSFDNTFSAQNTIGLKDPTRAAKKGKNNYKQYRKIIDNKQLRESIEKNINEFGIYGDDVINNYKNPAINPENGIVPTSTINPIVYKNGYGEKVSIKLAWNEASREVRVGSSRKDQINLTPLFTKDSYWFGNKVNIKGKDKNIRDLVKFTIQSVNTNEPYLSDFMVFRAYLTQFSDNVDASWADIKYAGRGNPFHIYSGFTRKVSVGFKVAALSKEEMQPMYSKLNNLMASLMPDYGGGNVMRGPLHRLTVGNYFDAQLGILTSISYTIPNDSPWEIAIDEPEGGTSQVLILPHIIEVTMNFTPIGVETGGIGGPSNKIEQKDKNTSFLAQNTTGNDKSTIQYYDSFFNK